MLIRRIMKRPIRSVPETASIGQAATAMREYNVGALAVLDGGQLSGLITDRDIVTRCLSKHDSMHTLTVAEYMSRDVITCCETEEIEIAAALMGDHQIRRLPVLNADGNLAGMLTLDSIAEDYCEHLAGETLGEIVETR